MPRIAADATVDHRAELAAEVDVGPGCYIGPDVRLGPGCRLIANVTILGNTEIGSGNLFYPSAVIGAAPQDLKYQGGDTKLIIGDENVFREGVTAHTGTELAGGVTRVGNKNQFQVGTHLAHDVRVGNNCVLSNSVQIAGHVHIEDHVNISGLTGVQQFVTIGQYSFVIGASRCTTDTPPYLIYGGYGGTVLGVNIKGLGRWGFDEPAIQQLRDLCRSLFPRKEQHTADFSLRGLYNLTVARRRNKNARSSMIRRLRDAESNGPLSEHCQYLIDFVKRSIVSGVHGRYLESLRRDENAFRPAFYEAGGSQQ